MDLGQILYDKWKETVPGNARFYLQSMFGDRSQPLTEQDLNTNELSELAQTVQRAHQIRPETLNSEEEYQRQLGRPIPPELKASIDNRRARHQQGLGYVTYADYNTGNEPNSNFTSDMLGRFNYKLNPDGTTRVVDNYDFNNNGRESIVEWFDTMSTLEKLMSSFGYGDNAIVKNPNLNQIAANLGMAFMGHEKDGRPIRMTLPARPGERRGR